MQSNTSSRRGFFGKTLAWLGAAFAWPKVASSADDALPSAPTLDEGLQEGYWTYDAENRVTCYYDGPVTKTEQFFYEVDYDGNVNLIECDESL